MAVAQVRRGPRRSGGSLLGIMGVVVLVVTGCGSPGGAAGGVATISGWPAGGPADVVPAGCPPLPEVQTLPGTAVPTAALECVADTERVPGGGEWSVVVRRRATAGITALVAALRLPSQPRTDGSCTLELRMPVLVELEVGAKRIRVATPKNPCGQTRPEVIEAYGALSWVPATRTRVSRIRSEAAVRAGCERWKDMVATTAHDARVGGPGGVFPGVSTLRVCRYRSNYPAGWVDDGRSTIDGTPESGTVLGAAATTEVVRSLSAAGPAAPCRTPHGRFAVLTAGGGAEVYVELDGCLRILAPDATLRQGDLRVVNLLLAP